MKYSWQEVILFIFVASSTTFITNRFGFIPGCFYLFFLTQLKISSTQEGI
jgi:hypothetical protein